MAYLLRKCISLVCLICFSSLQCNIAMALVSACKCAERSQGHAHCDDMHEEAEQSGQSRVMLCQCIKSDQAALNHSGALVPLVLFGEIEQNVRSVTLPMPTQYSGQRYEIFIGFDPPYPRAS